VDRTIEVSKGDYGSVVRPVAAWGLLALLAANMLIDALEVSIMVVAMPVIAEDLGYHRVTAVWLISGFACGFAGALMIGGRLAERFGRRRVYLLALALFVTVSLAGGIVVDPLLLSGIRVIKGMCAALTAPLGAAIIATTFADERGRDRALSIYALAGGSGFAAGLLAAGFLTLHDWRLTFLVPAIVVSVILVAGVRLIPRDPRRGQDSINRSTPLGAASALFFALAVIAAVSAISTAATYGWHDPRAVVCVAVAVLLAGGLVRSERNNGEPLYFSPALANRTLLSSMVCAAAMNGTNLALLVIVTMRLQYDLGWTALHAALGVLPASVPLVLAAPLSGALIARFGTAPLTAAGMMCTGSAALTFAVPEAPTDYTVDVLPGMLLLGAGFTFGFAALNSRATSTVDANHKSAAAGLYQTAVQLAAAFVPMTVALCWVVDQQLAARVAIVVALLGILSACAGIWVSRAQLSDVDRSKEQQ
jgi:MFS family permease